MQKKLWLLLIAFCVSISLKGIELSITQPGFYLLGDNLTSNPTGADSIINIASNDVVVDLGSYVLSQGNATASVNGINIQPGFDDVTIQNGTIRGVSFNGIQVGAACERIKILNVRFENCGIGIALNGLVGLNITNSEIRGCGFYSCANTGTGSVINITQSNKLNLSDIEIANTVSSANTNLILMSTVTLSNFTNVTIQNNVITGSLNAIVDSSGIGNLFNNIVIQNNSGSVSFGGFFGGPITANTYIDCVVLFNSSSAGFLRAFDMQTTSNCFFQSCRAASNSAVTLTTGFSFIINSNNNTFIDCISSGNIVTGVGATCNGFLLNSANFTVMIRCQASFNSSVAANAIGLSISGAGSNNCSFLDCIFSRNLGVNAVVSFGVQVGVGANNLFARTISFNNNTTPGNELNGLPVGSVTTPASPGSSNLAGILPPYTNLALDS